MSKKYGTLSPYRPGEQVSLPGGRLFMHPFIDLRTLNPNSPILKTGVFLGGTKDENKLAEERLGIRPDGNQFIGLGAITGTFHPVQTIQKGSNETAIPQPSAEP